MTALDCFFFCICIRRQGSFDVLDLKTPASWLSRTLFFCLVRPSSDCSWGLHQAQTQKPRLWLQASGGSFNEIRSMSGCGKGRFSRARSKPGLGKFRRAGPRLGNMEG